MDSPISNTVTLHDPNHGPTHLTPDTPSLWGCIEVGLYRGGAVSAWGCIGMGLYRGGAVSAWGCIGVGLYRGWGLRGMGQSRTIIHYWRTAISLIHMHNVTAFSRRSCEIGHLCHWGRCSRSATVASYRVLSLRLKFWYLLIWQAVTITQWLFVYYDRQKKNWNQFCFLISID